MNMRNLLALILFTLHVTDLVAQERTVFTAFERDGSYVASTLTNKKIFFMPNKGITSIDDIQRIPHIEDAQAFTLPRNKIAALRANTFNNPKFKHLYQLDLGQNNISVIEPGAFKGLENLRILLLNDNKLRELPPDLSSTLPNLKVLSVGGNPGKELKKEAHKQLPNAWVYDGRITRGFLRRAAQFALLIGLAVLIEQLYVHYKHKKLPDPPQPMEWPEPPKKPDVRAFLAASDDEKLKMLESKIMRGDNETIQSFLGSIKEEQQRTALLNTPLDTFGETLLMRAAFKGNTEILSTLLDYGARINTQDTSGYTALMKAVFFGRKDAVTFLLQRPGINRELPSKFRKTAQDYAQLDPDIAALFNPVQPE